MSEDCLTLNVWTRAKITDEKLPVMVWFHGGALVWGSGSEYPGDILTEHGVILVTVNYRLGPFGFFLIRNYQPRQVLLEIRVSVIKSNHLSGLKKILVSLVVIPII